MTIAVDNTPLVLQRGRSLPAGVLLEKHTGAAADSFCRIGQCQRSLVVMDGRPGLVCLAYPKGGETAATRAVDDRLPLWT